MRPIATGSIVEAPRPGQIGLLDKYGGLLLVVSSGDVKSEETQSILQELHGDGRIRSAACGCTPDGTAMYLRMRRGRLEICDMPRGCETHAPACNRYREFCQRRRDPDAVRHRETGMDRLLRGRKARRTPCPSDSESPSTRTLPARQSGSRTLGAALQAMADVTGLNRHDPSRTNLTWMDVATCAQAELIGYAQKRGKRSAVVIGGANRSRSLSDALEDARATVVIGCVTRVRYRAHVAEVFLEGMDAPIQTEIKKWQRALRRATSRLVRPILQSRNLAAGRVVMAMDVSPVHSGEIEIGAIGMMAVTKHWIPIESTHERDAADRLVAAGYRFTKDIYRPDDWPMRPDFRLHLSSGTDFALEVHGLEHTDYRERKAVSDGWLRTNMPGRFSIWDVARGEAFPTLPPP